MCPRCGYCERDHVSADALALNRPPQANLPIGTINGDPQFQVNPDGSISRAFDGVLANRPTHLQPH